MIFAGQPFALLKADDRKNSPCDMNMNGSPLGCGGNRAPRPAAHTTPRTRVTIKHGLVVPYSAFRPFRGIGFSHLGNGISFAAGTFPYSCSCRVAFTAEESASNSAIIRLMVRRFSTVPSLA